MQKSALDRVKAVVSQGPAALRRLLPGSRGDASSSAAPAERDGGANVAAIDQSTGGFRRLLDSPLLFRSVLGALVLMGTVQWALIFFNYWR
ncbi:MAG: hypothetical protein AAF416_11615 [Pseudomonadota bacterium]